MKKSLSSQDLHPTTREHSPKDPPTSSKGGGARQGVMSACSQLVEWEKALTLKFAEDYEKRLQRKLLMHDCLRGRYLFLCALVLRSAIQKKSPRTV